MTDPVACPKEGGAQGTKLFPDSYPPAGWLPSLGPKVYCGCGHQTTFGLKEGMKWLADPAVKFRCEECDKKQCRVCDGVLRVPKGEREALKAKYADQIAKSNAEKAGGQQPAAASSAEAASSSQPASNYFRHTAKRGPSCLLLKLRQKSSFSPKSFRITHFKAPNVGL
eukprot:g39384.t1